MQLGSDFGDSNTYTGHYSRLYNYLIQSVWLRSCKEYIHIFHDMSDTAATTTMTEHVPKMDTNESKEGRDAKRQLSVSPITSPPKNKHKKTSNAAKSAAGSEDELENKTKQLLLDKIKSLEIELKNIKMGKIQHAEAQLRTTKDLEITSAKKNEFVKNY